MNLPAVNYQPINQQIGEMDALPLEYELLDRDAIREANLSNFIGDAALKSFLRVHVSHVEEEFVDLGD